MICSDCTKGHPRYGRRGYKYDTGHWYRREFASPEDYQIVCKLTPWLLITIYACPRSEPFNKAARFIILLGNGNTVDQLSRIEMPGSDLEIAKRRALQLAKTACEKAAELAGGLLADIPEPTPEREPPGLRALRRAIARAQKTLDAVRQPKMPIAVEGDY